MNSNHLQAWRKMGYAIQFLPKTHFTSSTSLTKLGYGTECEHLLPHCIGWPQAGFIACIPGVVSQKTKKKKEKSDSRFKGLDLLTDGGGRLQIFLWLCSLPYASHANSALPDLTRSTQLLGCQQTSEYISDSSSFLWSTHSDRSLLLFLTILVYMHGW